VMTATPIPRTLAMTLYGDLDVSVIDELPAGRKPIKTVHRYDSHRLRVFGFMKEEIQKGRQVYVVYPLIEESEKVDFKYLTDGYESIVRAFPECYISIVHGRMKSAEKDLLEADEINEKEYEKAAAAYNPTDGFVYAIASDDMLPTSAPRSRIYRVSPTNGLATQIGDPLGITLTTGSGGEM